VKRTDARAASAGPVTVTANCCVPPGAIATVVGEMLTETAPPDAPQAEASATQQVSSSSAARRASDGFMCASGREW
jgi:hypothetical protein